MTQSYDDLISPDSLSFQRSGSGLTFDELYSFYNTFPVNYKYFSPIRYWAFDASGTFNDGVITAVYSSSHPSYSVDTVAYQTAWSPATFEAEFYDFFKMYATESTAYQVSRSETDPGGGFDEVPVGVTILTWRTDTFSGSNDAPV